MIRILLRGNSNEQRYLGSSVKSECDS